MESFSLLLAFHLTFATPAFAEGQWCARLLLVVHKVPRSNTAWSLRGCRLKQVLPFFLNLCGVLIYHLHSVPREYQELSQTHNKRE
ncbi:hypothetical protein BJY01DRAFT_7841 [Aspergillus pseudoustus]|uniref:Secreted protein n=1 Tax=Aspergillus pseudoustus TaxID=1810923 RepID=A0ABR4JNW6_9EURO